MTRVLAIVVALLVAGCAGGSGGPGSSDGGGAVTVFAAASLRVPIDSSIAAYRSSHPGVRISASYDASSALRAQIEQGAPADLFFSADVRTAQALAEEGLADAPVPFATTDLAIVVPSGNPAAIRSPADLATGGVKIVAAGPEVPISVYADRLIANLAALPGYPTDYVRRVQTNVVSREQNVKAVAAKVGLGEADAGIVYETDARAAPELAAIPIPAAANVSVTYAAVAIRGRGERAAADGFLRFVVDAPESDRIFADAGFERPR